MYICKIPQNVWDQEFLAIGLEFAQADEAADAGEEIGFVLLHQESIRTPELARRDDG